MHFDERDFAFLPTIAVGHFLIANFQFSKIFLFYEKLILFNQLLERRIERSFRKMLLFCGWTKNYLLNIAYLKCGNMCNPNESTG
jgi:hypothetical protein